MGEAIVRKVGLWALIMLSACSSGSNANANAEASAASTVAEPASSSPSIVTTEAGTYRVEVNPKVDVASLPTNADLKMVDGDLTQYAIKLCQLDFANKLSPDRCEVFVQSDSGGLLSGYATILQGADVRIDTALETDKQRAGLGCFVSGKLDNSNFEQPDAKLNVASDFEARLPYYAWEKSPGDWMVSSEEDGDNTSAGVWYVTKKNNKLRITQERWSYCYKDDKVYIDEVFNQAVTLTRESASR